ncbi:hypothetical protein pipiens_016442, partial [Culex pipiens pipiens]
VSDTDLEVIEATGAGDHGGMAAQAGTGPLPDIRNR